MRKRFINQRLKIELRRYLENKQVGGFLCSG